MTRVMFQFRHDKEAPSLQDVCLRYSLEDDDVDHDFGVIQTDSVDRLFVVLVNENAQRRLESRMQELGEDKDPAVGVFSNPRVETTEDVAPHSHASPGVAAQRRSPLGLGYSVRQEQRQRESRKAHERESRSPLPAHD